LKLGLEVDEAGVIRRIGMQVSACAVGQSSAAVLAQAAIGKNAKDIAATKSAIESWLEADAPLPDWPGFDALEPAQPHAGRHGALLLPWTAAMEALCSQAASG
jgi:NifU-like protein involved in Fe-S cluster formation